MIRVRRNLGAQRASALTRGSARRASSRSQRCRTWLKQRAAIIRNWRYARGRQLPGRGSRLARARAAIWDTNERPAATTARRSAARKHIMKCAMCRWRAVPAAARPARGAQGRAPIRLGQTTASIAAAAAPRCSTPGPRFDAHLKCAPAGSRRGGSRASFRRRVVELAATRWPRRAGTGVRGHSERLRHDPRSRKHSSMGKNRESSLLIK